MNNYDLIIVGAGAAGLTAGLYATRKGLRTLIISSDLGGQTATTLTVENYPGVIGKTGPEIMQKFLEQYLSFDGTIKYQKVTSVVKEKDNFLVSTAHEKYNTTAVILAFGKTPKPLDVIGADGLGEDQIGHAVGDLTLYRDKKVAVIGGCNSAAQFAIDAAQVANSVVIINNSAELNCDQSIADELAKLSEKISMMFDAKIRTVANKEGRISINILSGNSTTDILVDKILVAIGYANQTDWLGSMVETDKIGQIIIDCDCGTNTPGLFAAGDVTNIAHKQIVISAAEGAKAAIAVVKYIDSLNGVRTPTLDWGKSSAKDEK